MLEVTSHQVYRLQNKPGKLCRCGENVAFVEGRTTFRISSPISVLFWCEALSKSHFSGSRFWARELFLDEEAISGRGSCFWTRVPYVEYSYVWPFSSFSEGVQLAWDFRTPLFSSSEGNSGWLLEVIARGVRLFVGWGLSILLITVFGIP
jgi:hypothetical protein